MNGNRFAVAIVLVALLSIAGIAGVSASRSSADSSIAAPNWLLAETQQAVAACSGEAVGDNSAAAIDTPKTASWTLTTVDTYLKSLPEKSSTEASNGSKSLYVVTVEGKFTAQHSRPGSPAPTGSQLLLVFDPDTHALSIVGVMNTPIDKSVFETANEMAL